MIIQHLNNPKNGNAILNTHVIYSEQYTAMQSYNTVICAQIFSAGTVYLDKDWKYSNTTSKHRSIFLGETTKDTQEHIDSGKYKVVDNLASLLDTLK